MSSWRVLDADTGVMTNGYVFNDNGGQANSFCVRIAEGEYLVISAPTVDEVAWTEFEEFGKPVGFVAPNGFHHLGLNSCRERWPEARFFAADETQARIAKKGDGVDVPWESMGALQEILPSHVGVREAPHTKAGETWGWCKTATGNVFYGSDVVCNWQEFPGNFLLSFFWKMSGSGPGFRPFHLAQMAIAKDKKKLFGAFLDDLEENPPNVILPGHGDVLQHDGLAGEARSIFAEAAGR